MTFAIESFFPRSEYKEECRKNAKLTPLYLIALNQSSETIIKQLQAKDPNYQEPKFGFSALSIATITHNHKVMGYLLNDAKANPSPQDWGSLTPLHYACAENDMAAVHLLQKAMKVEKMAKDIFEIFPGWKNFLQPDFPQETDYVSYWREKETLTQETAIKFFEKTGCHFFDGVFCDQENFIFLLEDRLKQQTCHRDKSYSRVNEKLVSQYLEMERGSKKTLFSVSSQGIAGNGVRAEENIPYGTICFTYGGEVKKKKEAGNYTLDFIDASEWQNWGPLVNDGFPNLGYFKLLLPDSRTIYVLFTLRDIEKGEFLYADYSFVHHMKILPRVELNYAEMEKFFKKNSPLALWKNLSKNLNERENFSAEDNLTNQVTRSYLTYLFHTPTALITLYLNKIISFKQIRDLISDQEFLSLIEINVDNSILTETLNNCLNALEHFEKLKKETTNSKLLTEFTHFCLELVSQYSFQVFNCFMSDLLTNEISVPQWLKQKETFQISTKVTQLILSGFVPPVTREVTSEYLIECRKLLHTLPEKSIAFIFIMIKEAVEKFSPHLKQFYETLLYPITENKN